MNSPKSLLRIAEKTCDFDRVHFAVGNPTAEAIVSRHAQLATDPKLITRLITRLMPRYAVALAFFEGYVQAMLEEVDSVVKERNELRARVNDMSGQLYRQEQANIGIVKKPPPPSPPAAPPKPEEISDDLAQAAVDYTNGIYSVNCTPSEVRHSLNVVVKNKWEQAVAGFIEGARWQLARTPSMPANEVQNSERAQYEQTIRLQNKTIEDRDVHIRELEKELASCKETIAATAVQAAEWRDRAERNDAIETRSTIDPIVFRDENERDFWDEQVHVLNRRGDRSAHDVANAADEMVEERRKRMPMIAAIDVEEITDELMDEAAFFASDSGNYGKNMSDLGLTEKQKRQIGETPHTWGFVVCGYLAGALRKVRKT